MRAPGLSAWKSRNSRGRNCTMADRLAARRTLGLPSGANSWHRSSRPWTFSRIALARRYSTAAAGVGSTPRLCRTNSVVPTRRSRSAIRLLAAEATRLARAAARATLRSSTAQTSICKAAKSIALPTHRVAVLAMVGGCHIALPGAHDHLSATEFEVEARRHVHRVPQRRQPLARLRRHVPLQRHTVVVIEHAPAR